MKPQEFHEQLHDDDHERDNPIWRALRGLLTVPVKVVRGATTKRYIQANEDEED